MATKVRIFPTSAQEKRLAVHLRKVARAAGAIIEPHINGAEIRDEQTMIEALRRYSQALIPWASTVVGKSLQDINATNRRQFIALSETIGDKLKRDMAGSDIGAVAKLLQDRQVNLIKSLPLEAGQRAQELARSAMTGGRRADEVAQELMRTTQVTESRATLIARTEISKANAALTQARAQFIGATHYIWMTQDDEAVRESHAEMDGQVFAYATPPTLSDGTTGGPGEFPNCRCWAQPIIPD